MRFFLISVMTFFVFYINAEEKKIDLISIRHISPKGRVQDKEYNQNIPVVDQLISKGTDAIPILINFLEDERQLEKGVVDFWPEVKVGDMAHIILFDFFTDESFVKSTIPEIKFLLGEDFFPDKPSWEKWYDLIKEHGRISVKKYWQKIWENYREFIQWDVKKRCFTISPYNVEEYFNKKYSDTILNAKKHHKIQDDKKNNIFDFNIIINAIEDDFSAYIVKDGDFGAYDDGKIKKQKLLLVLVKSFSNKILSEVDISDNYYGASLFDTKDDAVQIVADNTGQHYVLTQLRRGGDGDHTENRMSVYKIKGGALKKLSEHNIHEAVIEIKKDSIEVSGRHIITFCYTCGGWEVSEKDNLFLIPLKISIKNEKVISTCTMKKDEKQKMIKQFEKTKATRLKELSTYKYDKRELNAVKEITDEFYRIIGR